MPQLVHLFDDDAMAGRWPPVGDDRRLEVFEQRIWNAGEIQYAIFPARTDELIGLVNAHGIDELNATTALGFVVHPRLWRRGWTFEAVVLFLDLLFRWHGFRKVYCEMSEATLAAFGGAVDRWLTREATFRSHVTDGRGGYQDWHVLSLSRSAWDPDIVRLVTGLTTAPAPA
jgi:RimJ/RimL family protein N-acetyltransferase